MWDDHAVCQCDVGMFVTRLVRSGYAKQARVRVIGQDSCTALGSHWSRSLTSYKTNLIFFSKMANIFFMQNGTFFLHDCSRNFSARTLKWSWDSSVMAQLRCKYKDWCWWAAPLSSKSLLFKERTFQSAAAAAAHQRTGQERKLQLFRQAVITLF